MKQKGLHLITHDQQCKQRRKLISRREKYRGPKYQTWPPDQPAAGHCLHSVARTRFYSNLHFYELNRFFTATKQKNR